MSESEMRRQLDGTFRTYSLERGYHTLRVPETWFPGCGKTPRDLQHEAEAARKAAAKRERDVLAERRRERAAMKLAIREAPPAGVSLERALEAVLRAWDVTSAQFLGASRTPRVVGARAHFAWLVRMRRPDLSLADIGRFMGRDHSTVLTASGRFATRPHHERVEAVDRELASE